MEVITKYKAVDGHEFRTEHECIAYEALIISTLAIMDQLPKKPKDDGCRFSNGHGYLQHDKETFDKVKKELLHLFATKVDHKWIQQSIDGENIHPSWVARIIGDYNLNPFHEAWYRIQCVDRNYREWGQPYFANTPEHNGEYVQLNITST